MSERFRDVASIDYPILDCDAHVNEPPELWQERVPARMKQRAPRVERVPDGEVWVFDDGKERWPVGLTAVAGLSFFDYKPIGVTFPNGSIDPRPEDDRFWARCEEAELPVAVHIGSFVRGGLATRRESWSSLAFVGMAALTKAGGQTLPVVCDLLFSGIFARFPRLRIVLVESNIGWIPTLLEQADDMFMRYRWYTKAVLEQKAFPSERSDWPNSRVTIERVFRDVPKEQVRKMLHANCKELYRLDHVPDRLADLSPRG